MELFGPSESTPRIERFTDLSCAKSIDLKFDVMDKKHSLAWSEMEIPSVSYQKLIQATLDFRSHFDLVP